MSRVLLLGGEGVLADRLQAMPGTQVAPLATARVDDPVFDIVSLLSDVDLPDLVIVAGSVHPERSSELAAKVAVHFPDLQVVRGVRADAALDELASLVDTTATASDDVTPRPAELTSPSCDARLISVVSPKGGVGKTTVAVNLAVGLAEQSPLGVVLVDLDLQFGDVAAHLDIVASATIEHAFAAEAAADTLLVKSHLQVHEGGFYVLVGADSPAANDKITSEQIHRLLDQLLTQFRYVVVDTAAGLSDATLAAVEKAGTLVLVTTMDVATARDVRKEVDILAELELLPPERCLVLNQYDRHSGMTTRDIEQTIGLPVDAVVSRHRDIGLAANRGEPLLLGKKPGAIGKELRALARLFDAPPPDAYQGRELP